LEQVVHEIEVACLPDALPESIEVDVSGMKVDDVIHIKDIVMPEGVKAVGNPEQIVFVVELPAVEEEVKPAAAEGAEGATAAEPEVIGEKEKAERAAAKDAAKGGKEGGKPAEKK
jgi:large subunit ribosomal protein L25